jgi:hypothetical protein
MRDLTRDATIEAAFDMARHLLGILHRKNILDPGRVRAILTEDDRMRGYLRGQIRFGVGHMLPDDAREYLLRLLSEKPAKPPRRGRPAAKSSRDFWIAQTVGRLVEKHGVAPTRNRASADKDERPTTACGIIARALRELGVNLSETAVETIWSRRRPDDFVLWDERFAPKKRTRLSTGRFKPQSMQHTIIWHYLRREAVRRK